jgi:predicted P-loop ATPase/GTPase
LIKEITLFTLLSVLMYTKQLLLVFNKEKKYIPLENLREFTMEDIMLDKELVDMIKEREKQRLIDECLKVLNSKTEEE